MNKKLILAGVVLVAGLVTLTAYKTKEQQQQEIAAAITAKLDEFRMQKQDECTMRVNDEAQRRYDEYGASLPPAKAGTPGATTKKSTTAPKTVTPLPQTVPADPQKQRGGAAQEGNVEEQKKREGAAPPGDVESQKKRGGASKQEGGGN